MKGSMIGVICLLLEENRKQAEISVMINRDQWQHGYATRAIQAVADFAFSNPNINQPTLEALIGAVQGFMWQLSTHCREMRFSI